MRRLISFVLILSSFVIKAQTPLQTAIDTKAKAIAPKLIEWRRHIHQNPELGNREFKTQQYIANHLRSLGIEVTLLAKTGVLGVLKGGGGGGCCASCSPARERCLGFPHDKRQRICVTCAQARTVPAPQPE